MDNPYFSSYDGKLKGYFRYLSNQECRNFKQGDHVLLHDTRIDKVYRLKITSIKSRKKYPQFIIHWKWGLHVYGYLEVNPEVRTHFSDFCARVDEQEYKNALSNSGIENCLNGGQNA